MQCAPIPPEESERLQALRDLLILDTPPEQRFDRVVQFARDEFEVPIVLLSLIDSERQWFKANEGMTVTETPRDISFCGHAILQAEIFVVPDAHLDPRFADNPLVTGPPHVRFYAGAPLEVAPGLRVGTLCLISPQPRSFDATDRAILGVLRDVVVSELRGSKDAEA